MKSNALFFMVPFVTVAIALAGPAPANANAEKYAELKKEADQLFEDGEFAKAKSIYLTLVNEHDQAHEPQVFFNLGVCFEEQEDWENALHAYIPFLIPPFNEDIEFASTVQLRCVKIYLDKVGDKEKAHDTLRHTLESMHKDYRHNPDYPKANAVLEEAARLYKALEVELKIEPNIKEE